MSKAGQFECTSSTTELPVSGDLAQVCRETLGAALRAVVLTGSLARNEVSYIRKEGRAVLLSDLEAVVVLHDGAPLPSRQATQSLCACVEQRLAARGVCVHVSLSLVHASYLQRLPPHIYSYELRACGLVVSGEPTILEQIPYCAASGLSAEDAWRMLSNRLVEQMETAAESYGNDAPRYRSIKLCLDLASSLLVIFGRFEAGYCARLRCLEEFASTSDAQQLAIPIHDFLPLVRMCTKAKLHPEVAIDFGAGFAEQITRWAWQTWLWELQRLTGTYAAADEMIRTLAGSQGSSNLLRGWFYAVRRTGWLRSTRYWPRWLSLLAAGLTPRYAVYLAAYQLQHACHEQISGASIQCVESVCDLLPIARVTQVSTAAAALQQVVWNYKEFVRETRA